MGMSISRTSLVLAASLVLPVAGCATTGSPAAGPGAVSPVVSPADRTAESSAAGPSDRLTTMSVADWTGFPDAGQADVTFHLGEHCATLQGPPDEAVLLVWPDGLASIDPDRPDTVRLKEPVTGAIAEVTNGQRVSLGGTPVTGVRTFVVPPHESCPTEDLFLVTQIN
jgi:hypothetical protein